MTTLQITLPDALAEEAARAGLLNSSALERLLRDQLRRERIDAMQSARSRLAGAPLPELSPTEIDAEIAQYRAEPHASGA
jgi:hypothetical protein